MAVPIGLGPSWAHAMAALVNDEFVSVEKVLPPPFLAYAGYSWTHVLSLGPFGFLRKHDAWVCRLIASITWR